MRTLSITAAVVAAAFALSACGDREAESETDVAEAEVSTDLPEEQLSDADLQAAADAAAASASGATTDGTMPPAEADTMNPDAPTSDQSY